MPYLEIVITEFAEPVHLFELPFYKAFDFPLKLLEMQQWHSRGETEVGTILAVVIGSATALLVTQQEIFGELLAHPVTWYLMVVALFIS